MSLLKRLGRGHLSDSQYADLWTTGAAHPHLDECAQCRAGYEAFRAWLSGVGSELRTEADEAFPADRLAIQQAQIARRLEALERPARVIPFPRAARAIISGNSHVRRWVSVAAGAALITGFGLGQVYPLRTVLREGAVQNTTAHFSGPVAASRARDLTPLPANETDDELLSDAFARPRVSTLSALDEMTPHARDLAK